MYSNKILVLDLDETLGHFVQLGIFWDELQDFYSTSLPDEYFFELMDIFPEFQRPYIQYILNFANTQKKNKQIKYIVLYTNNQGPKSWAKLIINYFNKKNGNKIFDFIIGAYKINNIICEPKRSSNNKKYTDLLNYLNIDKSYKTLFIDDQYHPEMNANNVSYIRIKPYHYSFPIKEMVDRYCSKSNFISIPNKLLLNQHILKKYSYYKYYYHNKSKMEQKIDNILSKEILKHILNFINI